MEKIITIVSSEIKTTKSGDKEYASIKDQDGDIYSVWDKELWAILDKDMTARIDFIKQGNFRNITKAESVESILEKEAVEKVKKINYDDKEDFTNRRCALIQASNEVCNGQLPLDEAIVRAEIYYGFLSKKIRYPDNSLFRKHLGTAKIVDQKAEAKKETPD